MAAPLPEAEPPEPARAAPALAAWELDAALGARRRRGGAGGLGALALLLLGLGRRQDLRVALGHELLDLGGEAGEHVLGLHLLGLHGLEVGGLGGLEVLELGLLRLELCRGVVEGLLGCGHLVDEGDVGLGDLVHVVDVARELLEARGGHEDLEEVGVAGLVVGVHPGGEELLLPLELLLLPLYLRLGVGDLAVDVLDLPHGLGELGGELLVLVAEAVELGLGGVELCLGVGEGVEGRLGGRRPGQGPGDGRREGGEAEPAGDPEEAAAGEAAEGGVGGGGFPMGGGVGAPLSDGLRHCGSVRSACTSYHGRGLFQSVLRVKTIPV